ncbi:hypothetical protein DNTS_033492 [Danionella cerebrum]|uniref:F-box domain-containing protein n=1 Tax=Danionella cerebrum TaxID=2873325 RepID=A0A553PE19_9TELE|nr:hypothetical protein DNTS_033492 [Danionella translucida]
MALCSSVGALALPSELIVHIFSFLSDRDKLRASAVCSRWRECLFYPALWTELKLRIGGGKNGGASGSEQSPRLEFLMRKFGSFVRELQLEFAPVDGYLNPLPNGVESAESDPQFAKDATATYLDQMLCVLGSLRNNRNLQKLSFYGDTCILQDDGILDSSYLSQVDHGGKKIKEIQQLFEELLSNSRQMKWLASVFMLGVVTPCSLAALSNPSTSSLEHLCLIDNQLPSLVSTIELERLANLRSLALDFCDFTSDMCQLLACVDRVPLHRLSLLLNGAALDVKPLDGTATEDDWKALVRRSTNLRVYMLAMDVCSQDLLRVLKPSIPMERVHLDSYSTLVTDGVLELISHQYHKTLTHFILMRDEAGFPDLSGNRNEDPLVLLAWRCLHLTVLIIHASLSFGRLRSSVFENRNLRSSTKVAVYNSVCVSTLLYGAETWTPYRRHITLLQSFHIRCLQKILGLIWKDRVQHAEILQSTNSIYMEAAVAKKLLRWMGHTIRMPEHRLPRQLQGAKRAPGGQKQCYKDYIKKLLKNSGINPMQLEALAQDRSAWQVTCARNPRQRPTAARRETQTKTPEGSRGSSVLWLPLHHLRMSYTVWSHNLVAISRLRGSNLKILEVSEESIDFDPDQSVYIEGDPVHNLIKEVSLGLGRVWHPSMDSSVVLNEPTQHFHREMQSFSAGM